MEREPIPVESGEPGIVGPEVVLIVALVILLFCFLVGLTAYAGTRTAIEEFVRNYAPTAVPTRTVAALIGL